MNKRQMQKEKRREEILLAALDLFFQRGYSDTKISDIAQAANMSVGLLFHYFDSKEKLYEELIKLGLNGPQSVMPTQDSDPVDYLECTVNRLFTAIKSNPQVAKMFALMSHAQYNDSSPEGVKELISGSDIISPTIALLEKGQQDGGIRAGNPHALAIAFWMSIQGIAEELAKHPDAPCPDGEWIVDIVRRKR